MYCFLKGGRVTLTFYIYSNTKNIKVFTRERSIKSFNSIPGPQSLPGVGTLYQYLPVIGNYKFDKLHLNGYKKYNKFGHIVKEEIVPGVNIVWLFNPMDIETMFRCEGRYPERRSHLALEKYRLERSSIYNSGGLLPTEWARMSKCAPCSGKFKMAKFLHEELKGKRTVHLLTSVSKRERGANVNPS